MLEVGYDDEACSTTRNVIFLLDIAAPRTLITSTVKKLIIKDCQINTEGLWEIPIKINGI